MATVIPFPIPNLKQRPASDEMELLGRLKGLRTESQRQKDQFINDSDIESDIQLYRDKIKAPGTNDFFSANFVQTFISTEVSRLTDNRPIIRIQPRKKDLKRTAEAVQRIISALWSEEEMQRDLFAMGISAAIRSSAGLYVGWDTFKDSMDIEVLRNDQLWVDPCVIESGDIQKAEYVIIERIIPLSLLQDRFPGRGGLVKPDSVFSGPKARHSKPIDTPLDKMIGKETHKIENESMDRARVYECFYRDRQASTDGKALFPNGRRTVYAGNVVLWDGPNIYWHGKWPVEWFDWITDPDHLWGMSETRRLRRMQLSFNQVMDGTVKNHLLSNFFRITGDANALTEKMWKKLKNISNSLVLRKQRQNSDVSVEPPAPYGADKIAFSRYIFTVAQLLTGNVDAVLGENPGSLQSGTGLEGLQDSANIQNRARQSRLEDFLTRVGTLCMSNVFQFVPSGKAFSLMGPTGEALSFAFTRQELMFNEQSGYNEPLSAQERMEILQDLRFSVLPGSSEPGARQNRARLYMSMMQLGLVDRLEVLLAADFDRAVAEEMIQRATQDAQNNPVLQAQMSRRNSPASDAAV